MTRPPYRCAVGLMIKTNEVSEQGCLRSLQQVHFERIPSMMVGRRPILCSPKMTKSHNVLTRFGHLADLPGGKVLEKLLIGGHLIEPNPKIDR
jgi:hypothetical protein